MNDSHADAEGVTATIMGDDGTRFEGAAILRTRPHPVTARPALQLGVPDEALGFRPTRNVAFAIRVAGPAGSVRTYQSSAVWLDRVQTSWWFILDELGAGSWELGAGSW